MLIIMQDANIYLEKEINTLIFLKNNSHHAVDIHDFPFFLLVLALVIWFNVSPVSFNFRCCV